MARYRLTPDQRTAIQAFLRAYRQYPDVRPAPVYQFYRELRRMRCLACHGDSLEPPVATAEAVPVLTDAGAKLRTGWIHQVLTNRERVHRALTIRMPHYPAGQVSGLAEGFAKAGGVEPGDGIAAPRPSDAGAGMLGVSARKGGMACVGCHDWGPHRSLGEDGPQLINAAHRLRYEWYQRWMRNPARILSGTSMPNYFSSMDPARAEQTIATLWAALSLGARLPLPEGLGAVAAPDREARPEPVREAMVVRWDMPEATPAAIAVGMPGKISYCFDAGECRLRYAWYGGFVDLSETLYRKTDENRLTPTARILGEMFYKGQGFPFRVGAPDRVPAWRFKGYRIAGGYPEFHYLVDGIEVREHVVPAAAGVGITRRFAIGQVDREMWFEGRPVPLGTNVRFEVTARKEAG